MTRVHPFLVISIVAVVACASAREGRTRLADGSYKLECRKALADCLAELTDVCSEYGYDVIRGAEQTARNGVEPVNSVIVTSTAVVRCRSAGALFGQNPASGTPQPSAAPLAISGSCFPGSTQACLGPGACHGAQTCRDDGARYAPCDCGGAQGTPPSETSDAGPPATWATPPDGAAPP